MIRQQKRTILKLLARQLAALRNFAEKEPILKGFVLVKESLTRSQLLPFFLKESDLGCRVAFLSLVAIEQHSRVFFDPERKLNQDLFHQILSELVPIEHFYASIGGIVGYQATVLEKISEEPNSIDASIYRQAVGLDLSFSSSQANHAVLAGIETLSEMGMIFPLGGLGSRLDLKSGQGEPLPTAFLPFLGKSLLETLLRDVQAAEYLYYKLFTKQITIPIAMMTSKAHNSEEHIQSLCEKNSWFNRPSSSYLIFSQISVPVVAEDGQWSMLQPLEINLQPGGHGALWRTADEHGVFQWMERQGCFHLLIRQINNPIAGVDHGLLALIGIGKQQGKTLGFASCKRRVHAAEGTLVLRRDRGLCTLSNIEYTDFSRYGIEDVGTDGGYSLFPANTNILYVNLQKILPTIKKNPLPGLMINMKSLVPILMPDGTIEKRPGGRLESMMQSISDTLTAEFEEDLPSFLTYNRRNKTISATKKQFKDGSVLLETPEGAFYDYLYNSYELLKDYCNVQLPPFSNEEEYLKYGPSILFLYHPALGPLFEIIAQKIQGGTFAKWSELNLEITDIFLDSLSLSGSLLIEAENIMGHKEKNSLRYSNRTGKCFLRNVTVLNQGIDRKEAVHNYWRNNIVRNERMHIRLEGMSEFYAENLIFQGNMTLIIPDGEKWTAFRDSDGKLAYRIEPIEESSWEWNYAIDDGGIKLQQGSTSDILS